MYKHEPVCPACHGCGEVDSHITADVAQVFDKNGDLISQWPTKIVPNPAASEYISRENKFVPLWSIAICGKCHGTGLS